MINVLIIDDREEKVKLIKKILVDGCNLPLENIESADSIASGRRKLTEKVYDLLLLDLVLPLFSNEDPDPKGGLNFISELKGSAAMKTPIQIIGLTENINAYETKKGEFERLLFSVILCKQGSSDWIQQVKEKVDYAIRIKEAILKTINDNNKFDIGLICALQEEYNQMLDAFGGDTKWRNFEIEDYPYRFKTIEITTASNNVVRVIAATAGRPGVVPTAVLATTMYNLFKVQSVFMTGFSAGFPSKDLALGDVMVAKSIEDYANGKLIDDPANTVELLKEIHQVEASTELVTKIQEYASKPETRATLNAKVERANLKVNSRDNYAIQVSATCCGPFVVTSNDFVNQIKRDNRKLEGLDMEGYGLYLTSHLLTKRVKKDALWLKGIGDFANPQKSDGYHDTCSFTSATLLHMFIKEYM
ncbi:phosphorylase family protein [Bacteroides graminisolvens]|uniref:Putative nucleoside phosphorylase family n=1 Tax=Bacteroides graminisolvens DSM 19988 = JCM 15093 TaxID=1121097 RepID=A0A069DBU7_9BACE|nr:response regulator [Bacteroides graminisolvens]GAK37774.1 putative nucleoside phosphorylase family [Bacteroides graminisolvens DSM 19988 = JCM 15093]